MYHKLEFTLTKSQEAADAFSEFILLKYISLFINGHSQQKRKTMQTFDLLK